MVVLEVVAAVPVVLVMVVVVVNALIIVTLGIKTAWTVETK